MSTTPELFLRECVRFNNQRLIQSTYSDDQSCFLSVSTPSEISAAQVLITFWDANPNHTGAYIVSIYNNNL